MVKYGRTDLASEARTLRCLDGTQDLPGVAFRQEQAHGLPVTAVEILDEQGEQRLGNPSVIIIPWSFPAVLSGERRFSPRRPPPSATWSPAAFPRRPLSWC